MQSHNQTAPPKDKADPHGAFEQSLIDSLNLDNWSSGPNLAEIYAHFEQIREACESEDILTRRIREELIPRIGEENPSLPLKGVQQISTEEIRKAHLGLLFNGATEAVDGTLLPHDTLPISITQIGICAVSYQGEQGAYATRLFRRDLTVRENASLDDLFESLELRRSRGPQGLEDSDPRKMTTLAQRGLMSYAERSALFEKSNSKAVWKMGHGNPFPGEMLMSIWATRPELTGRATQLFQKMVEHERFVFVPSAGSREEITLGNALAPGEFIVLKTLCQSLKNMIETGGARGQMEKMQLDFAENFGDEVVSGLYRASNAAPAFKFYAHRKYVRTAALIALADSLLQEHRGFPMLINIADNVCRATFNPETHYATIRQAYAQAGYPFRFLSERETRIR